MFSALSKYFDIRNLVFLPVEHINYTNLGPDSHGSHRWGGGGRSERSRRGGLGTQRWIQGWRGPSWPPSLDPRSWICHRLCVRENSTSQLRRQTVTILSHVVEPEIGLLVGLKNRKFVSPICSTFLFIIYHLIFYCSRVFNFNLAGEEEKKLNVQKIYLYLKYLCCARAGVMPKKYQKWWRRQN